MFQDLLLRLREADKIVDRAERLDEIARIAHVSKDDPAYLTMFVLQDAAAHRQAGAARKLVSQADQARVTMDQIERRVDSITDRLSLAAALTRCWKVIGAGFAVGLALGLLLAVSVRRADDQRDVSSALLAAEIVREALASANGKAVADFIEAGDLIPLALCSKAGWEKRGDSCAPFAMPSGDLHGWRIRRPR